MNRRQFLQGLTAAGLTKLYTGLPPTTLAKVLAEDPSRAWDASPAIIEIISTTMESKRNELIANLMAHNPLLNRLTHN